jgi:hypothetical protein
MKPIQNYTPEAVERLKQWITEMNNTGYTKYYEIFVDGMRIVHKTNDVDEFDRYKIWVGPETQQIKVLIYNTIGSHRSKPFEFRTAKFPEEKNHKELVESLEKKNEELTRRLADAEAYIQKLENGQTQSSGGSFDLEGIISGLGKLTTQFPGLKDSLGGLGNMFNSAAPKQEERSEHFEASFRRKPSKEDSVENEDTLYSNPAEANKKDNETHTFTTEAKLQEEQARKMLELMQFFTDNSAYIDVVYDMVAEEKAKDRDDSTNRHRL